MTLAQSTECAREMTSQATSTMKATVINRFNHLSHGRRCFLLSTPESIRRRPYGGPANCDTAPGITPDCRSCRSAEHTSELQSLLRISYAAFCFQKTTIRTTPERHIAKR